MISNILLITSVLTGMAALVCESYRPRHWYVKWLAAALMIIAIFMAGAGGYYAR